MNDLDENEHRDSGFLNSDIGFRTALSDNELSVLFELNAEEIENGRSPEKVIDGLQINLSDLGVSQNILGKFEESIKNALKSQVRENFDLDTLYKTQSDLEQQIREGCAIIQQELSEENQEAALLDFSRAIATGTISIDQIGTIASNIAQNTLARESSRNTSYNQQEGAVNSIDNEIRENSNQNINKSLEQLANKSKEDIIDEVSITLGKSFPKIENSEEYLAAYDKNIKALPTIKEEKAAIEETGLVKEASEEMIEKSHHELADIKAKLEVLHGEIVIPDDSDKYHYAASYIFNNPEFDSSQMDSQKVKSTRVHFALKGKLMAYQMDDFDEETRTRELIEMILAAAQIYNKENVEDEVFMEYLTSLIQKSGIDILDGENISQEKLKIMMEKFPEASEIVKDFDRGIGIFDESNMKKFFDSKGCSVNEIEEKISEETVISKYARLFSECGEDNDKFLTILVDIYKNDPQIYKTVMDAIKSKNPVITQNISVDFDFDSVIKSNVALQEQVVQNIDEGMLLQVARDMELRGFDENGKLIESLLAYCSLHKDEKVSDGLKHAILQFSRDKLRGAFDEDGRIDLEKCNEYLNGNKRKEIDITDPETAMSSLMWIYVDDFITEKLVVDDVLLRGYLDEIEQMDNFQSVSHEFKRLSIEDPEKAKAFYMAYCKNSKFSNDLLSTTRFRSNAEWQSVLKEIEEIDINSATETEKLKLLSKILAVGSISDHSMSDKYEPLIIRPVFLDSVKELLESVGYEGNLEVNHVNQRQIDQFLIKKSEGKISLATGIIDFTNELGNNLQNLTKEEAIEEYKLFDKNGMLNKSNFDLFIQRASHIQDSLAQENLLKIAFELDPEKIERKYKAEYQNRLVLEGKIPQVGSCNPQDFYNQFGMLHNFLSQNHPEMQQMAEEEISKKCNGQTVDFSVSFEALTRVERLERFFKDNEENYTNEEEKTTIKNLINAHINNYNSGSRSLQRIYLDILMLHKMDTPASNELIELFDKIYSTNVCQKDPDGKRIFNQEKFEKSLLESDCSPEIIQEALGYMDLDLYPSAESMAAEVYDENDVELDDNTYQYDEEARKLELFKKDMDRCKLLEEEQIFEFAEKYAVNSKIFVNSMKYFTRRLNSGSEKEKYEAAQMMSILGKAKGLVDERYMSSQAATEILSDIDEKINEVDKTDLNAVRLEGSRALVRIASLSTLSLDGEYKVSPQALKELGKVAILMGDSLNDYILGVDGTINVKAITKVFESFEENTIDHEDNLIDRFRAYNYDKILSKEFGLEVTKTESKEEESTSQEINSQDADIQAGKPNDQEQGTDRNDSDDDGPEL